MADPVRVAALYRFARFPDPAALREPLRAACASAGVKGTLLLAREGINGTIAGHAAAIDAVLAHIRTLPGCADLAPRFKQRRGDAVPAAEGPPQARDRDDGRARRRSARRHRPLRRTCRLERADRRTRHSADRHAQRLRSGGSGSFAGAIDPATKSFGDFPAWVRDHRDALQGKRIAMFCTGGIRCEKATAFLRAEGLDDVHHLEGGILGYLEQVPAADSRWHGECFVFDERVAVGHGLAPGTHALCRACRMPVGPEDRASPLYAEGIGCPRCHATRDEARRAGYAERHRQVLLAEARGETHVGAAATRDRDRPVNNSARPAPAPPPARP